MHFAFGTDPRRYCNEYSSYFLNISLTKFCLDKLSVVKIKSSGGKPTRKSTQTHKKPFLRFYHAMKMSLFIFYFFDFTLFNLVVGSNPLQK